MNDDDLNMMLRQSAPVAVSKNPRVAAELRNVADGSRKSGARTARRRLALGVLLPALLAPAAAVGLTAGVEARVVPDFSLPLEFTTKAGERVECSIDYFNGELAWVEVNSDAVDFLKAQDWTNIGQRIYDRAAELVASNDPDVLQGTIGIDGGAPDLTKQWSVAWAVAENELTVSLIPGELFQPAGLGSDNDCQEQLP